MDPRANAAFAYCAQFNFGSAYYGIACIIDLKRVLLHVISLLRNFTKLLYNFISAALILCQIYLRQLIIYEFHFTALFSNFICNFLYNLTFVGLKMYQ